MGDTWRSAGLEEQFADKDRCLGTPNDGVCNHSWVTGTEIDGVLVILLAENATTANLIPGNLVKVEPDIAWVVTTKVGVPTRTVGVVPDVRCSTSCEGPRVC